MRVPYLEGNHTRRPVAFLPCFVSFLFDYPWSLGCAERGFQSICFPLRSGIWLNDLELGLATTPQYEPPSTRTPDACTPFPNSRHQRERARARVCVCHFLQYPRNFGSTGKASAQVHRSGCHWLDLWLKLKMPGCAAVPETESWRLTLRKQT